MPDYEPPQDHTCTPHRFLLAPGTPLWRAHSRKRAAVDFTPYRPGHRADAGRFDGTDDDPHGSFNAGLDAGIAIANLLLDKVFEPGKTFRTVRRSAVAGQRMSVVETASELALVSLRDGVDLSAVGQDLWLIQLAECPNGRVRRWGSWLRAQAPWAAGFIWPPTDAPGRHVVVLFDDRAESAFEPEPLYQIDLDDDYGALWLNSVLVEYRARIMPPRKPRADDDR